MSTRSRASRSPSSWQFAGLKLATTLSVLGAIVAEFMGASEGLGYLILSSTFNFEVARVFVSLLVLVAIGVAFFAIARALALDPCLLLMDEPFGALDEIARDRMSEELLKIWAASRVTVLFVTHSIPGAAFLSDRVVILTPRPGMVRRIVEVKLPRPRARKLKLSDEFMDYVCILHTELCRSMGAMRDD